VSCSTNSEHFHKVEESIGREQSPDKGDDRSALPSFKKIGDDPGHEYEQEGNCQEQKAASGVVRHRDT
jgi:hypothetical protein